MKEEAAKKVVHNAAMAVFRLEEAMHSDPETLARLIERSDAWPVILPARKPERKWVIDQLDKLGFARRCELNVLGKTDKESPTTQAALQVFAWLMRPLREKKKPGLLLAFNGGLTPVHMKKWKEWAEANATKIPARLTAC